MRRALTVLSFGSLIAVLLLLYAPTLFVAWESISATRSGSENSYFAFLEDRAIQDALLNSIAMAVPASLFATAGCYGSLSWARSRYPSKANWVMGALLLPFFATSTIVGLAFPMTIKRLFGFAAGPETATLAMITAALPLCAIVIAVQLRYYSEDLPRVAASLGATPGQIFRRVTFPLLGSSLAAAALMGFLYAFNNTDIALFATGNVATIPSLVWGKLRHGFDASIFQLSTSLTLSFLVCGLLSLTIVGSALRHRTKVITASV